MKVRINPVADIPLDFWYSKARGIVFDVIIKQDLTEGSIWYKLTNDESIKAKEKYKTDTESVGLSILKEHCIEVVGEYKGCHVDLHGNLSPIALSSPKVPDEVIFIDTTTNTIKQYPPTPQDVSTDVKIRRFPTGAIRSDNTGRERFDWISPLALKALAEFLATTENCFAQVNYFKGIPEDACVESLLRHVNDFQINGHKKEAVALLFNAVALVHTICLKEIGGYKEIYQSTELINRSEYKEK